MYRADASDNLQKIERLERELNLAYEEQYPASNDAEVGLALLRFRAQRLAKEIESFREKHRREPLWKRIGKRVTRVGLGLGFAAGAGAASIAWGVHARLASPSVAELANTAIELQEAAPASPRDQLAEPAATTEPAASAEPAATAAPAPTAEVDTNTSESEPPADGHVPLTAKDHRELLARSQAFFRAVEKHDGAALARLAHPTEGLVMDDERLSLTPALLRDCFTNRHLHTIPKDASSDETVDRTCGQILSSYAETPYARSPDVMFNAVPSNVSANSVQPAEPYVFFYLPPSEDSELSWKGVTLQFDWYGDEIVLKAVHKQYWTP